MCSEVPIIRPTLVLVYSGLYSEQVSLMRLIYIEKKMHFITETNGFTVRVVLILSGLNSGTSLYKL